MRIMLVAKVVAVKMVDSDVSILRAARIAVEKSKYMNDKKKRETLKKAYLLPSGLKARVFTGPKCP